MRATTIGIDLAKMGFSVHRVDARGKTVFREALKPAEIGEHPGLHDSTMSKVVNEKSRHQAIDNSGPELPCSLCLA